MLGLALWARGGKRCGAREGGARPKDAPGGYVPLRALFNLLGAAAILAAAIVAALPAAGKEPVRILMLGDSITAGYGLPEAESLPVVLEAALRKAGYDVRVTNGGVSGDTTAGGLARLDWMLASKPQLVIVELGANDALRALPPAESYANLDKILSTLDGAGLKVLLAGMLAPPNLGSEYGHAFAAIYPALAKKHGCLLYPFLLDGVAAEPALTQADGLHPNANGVVVIAARLAPYVERLLKL